MYEICGGWAILPNGIKKGISVAVEGDRIIDIGKTTEIRKKYKFSNSIGSDKYVISPGFVDSHLHSFQVAMRNKPTNKGLLPWLKKYIWKWEGEMTKKDAEKCARISYKELIENGVTSFVDYTSVRHTDEAFKVAKKFGLRATIGKTMMDRNSPSELIEDTDQSLIETEKLIKKWHGKEKGRLRYAVTPRFGITCSDDLLIEAIKLSKKYKTMITTHAHENKDEMDFDKKNYKKSAIKHFHDIGFLGDNTILAHSIHLSNDEMRRIAKTKTKISHCPGSNLALRSGYAPIPEMRKLGIDIGLGSDVAAYNNFSPFDQMRLSIKIQKLRGKKLNEHDAYMLATLGGANAIGLGTEIGSLEKGKKADIVLLEVDSRDTIPYIVRYGKNKMVKKVIIDGKLVLDK
ncbi:MAG: amidohydrolase family protein [Candidatus Micrarchaeota archaeon]